MKQKANGQLSPTLAKGIMQTMYDADPAVIAGKRALNRRKAPPPISPDCHRLYAAYPRHIGKKAALKAIAKALEVAPLEKVEAAVNRFKFCTDRWRREDRTFIPHPATWFNEGRYDDDPAEWERGAPERKKLDPLPEPPAWIGFMNANFPGWIKLDEIGSGLTWAGLPRNEQQFVIEQLAKAQ